MASIVSGKTEAGIRVLTLEGEIELDVSHQLKDAINEVFAEESFRDEKYIIIDLLKVSYLDSTGLGVLVGALKRCREIDGDCIIACPDTKIRRVFEITGLDKVFEIFPDQEKAVELILNKKAELEKISETINGIRVITPEKMSDMDGWIPVSEGISSFLETGTGNIVLDLTKNPMLSDTDQLILRVILSKFDKVDANLVLVTTDIGFIQRTKSVKMFERHRIFESQEAAFEFLTTTPNKSEQSAE